MSTATISLPLVVADVDVDPTLAIGDGELRFAADGNRADHLGPA